MGGLIVFRSAVVSKDSVFFFCFFFAFLETQKRRRPKYQKGRERIE